MDLGLKDKVAAVAASSSGLGLAVAVELAREGCKIALCSRDAARLERAAAQVREAAGCGAPAAAAERVLAVRADLASPQGPAEFIRAAAARLGPVDVLVANNGGPPAGPALGLGEEAWRFGFDLTFLSSQRLVAEAAPGMRERRWGRILFITSISVKQPIPDLVISTALRSAVVGYAKCLSDELAPHGVTVNCVAPGSTLTERLEQLLARRAESRRIDPARLREEEERKIPVRRFGRPEEFAAAVAFLASERASYITGTVLAVDGGVVRSLT
ncbi:MAG: SDR family oxidoreductase [Planctomycetes bacterium]|nr:SDR family oxidoreductase [Planctomycetota bacterium]